jgi:hypothetical protein
VTEEIIATGNCVHQSILIILRNLLIDIPTIPMDEADDNNAIDRTPQVAVAPE